MQTFRYVLVCVEDNPKSGIKNGFEMVGDEAYFSERTCAENARLIAQAMFVKDGTKYGFRCVHVEYEPPNLTRQ